MSGAEMDPVLSLRVHTHYGQILTSQWLPWAHTQAAKDAGKVSMQHLRFRNEWQALPQEMDNSPKMEGDKDVKCMTNVHCSLKLSSAYMPPIFSHWSLMGNPKYICNRKRFYQLSEIEEGNSTQGS